MNTEILNRIVAIIIVAVVVAVAVFGYQQFKKNTNQKQSITQINKKQNKQTNIKQNTKINPPTFDVIRLEPDGSIVVAGKAEPQSKIELITQNGKIIDNANSGQTGDFVIVPQNNIEPGDYVLSLNATNKNGKKINSKQTAVIHVPDKNKNDVLVVVNEEGQPSRIITIPKELEKKPEPETEPEEPKPQTQQEENEQEIVIAKKTEIRIEAVEIEDQQLYIAGQVENGETVRVYINDELIGTENGNEQNRFLIEKPYKLEPGEHTVRADVIDKNNGKVIQRAEVKLVHEVENKQNNNNQNTIETGTHLISIKKGDTLWHIAKKTYGTGFRYTTIYNANKDQIVDPDWIYIGQVFKIPENQNQ